MNPTFSDTHSIISSAIKLIGEHKSKFMVSKKVTLSIYALTEDGQLIDKLGSSMNPEPRRMQNLD